jgi:hypothetical protein
MRPTHHQFSRRLMRLPALSRVGGCLTASASTMCSTKVEPSVSWSTSTGPTAHMAGVRSARVRPSVTLNAATPPMRDSAASKWAKGSATHGIERHRSGTTGMPVGPPGASQLSSALTARCQTVTVSTRISLFVAGITC